MTDAANTQTAAAGEENALLQPTPDQDMAKFEGFSTRDGERVTPQSDTQTKPAAKTEAAAEDDDTGDTDAQKHKSAQDRINKAVGKQRAAERRAAAAEQALQQTNARLAAIEARLASGNPTTPAKPKSDPNAPQPADYEYGEVDARYIKDLAKYEARKEFNEAQTQQQKQQQTQQQTQEQAAFKAKVDDFVGKGLETHDDFDEVVLDNSNPFSQALVELMFESEVGPEIAYEAATDPKVRKQLSGMTPSRQAAWFGRQEASRSSESSGADDENEEGDESAAASAESPKTTKAPNPLKNKTRGNGAPKPTSPDTTNFAQFEKMAMGQ